MISNSDQYKEEKSKDLVSVIIPAFNAASFLEQTLQSVLSQDYPFLEVIVFNDGSTDNTEEIVKSLKDERIRYFFQTNRGVSKTRNLGLDQSRGKYIIFFDSDDFMPPQFISKRLNLLQEFRLFDFACGMVQKFNEEGVSIEGLYKAACIDIKTEILAFKPDVITCPSNYLFRREALLQNSLRFHESLASSADRYFLLEVAQQCIGVMCRDAGALLMYRYRSNSMSNYLSPKLIHDNEMFYELVLANIKPESSLRRIFLAKSTYVLAGAYFKLGRWFKCQRYALLSFLYSPFNFFRTFFRMGWSGL